ncbi:MAG: 2-dehydropantoate 2-reductase [bacterium]
MKIAVVGAGAIGGYLGGWLAASGEEVTFIARGANLEAIRARGMRVIGDDGADVVVRGALACERMSEAGPQDVVLLTVKANQVAAVAADIQHLCHEQTTIVTMQNGIPWWYFHKHGGEFEGTSIRSADPDGAIGRLIDSERIIGSVVYPAATLVQPGVVEVVEGRRFALGELDGSSSARVQAISAAFVKAGFKAPILDHIRSEIWLKVWGNLSFNPISALTHATLVDLLQFPETRALSVEMMREAEVIAGKLGITFRAGIDRRIAGAEKVGAHKTSMLQDVEAGKAIEIEALVGAVVELGRLTSTPTPHIDAVYACARLLAETLKRQNGKLAISPLWAVT